MIQVSRELCTGCGACLAACPKGALFLVDGCAEVDELLCDSCGVCISACREGALSLAATGDEPRSVQAMTAAQAMPPAEAQTRAITPLWSKSIVPALGAAIVFAGREILPRVVDILLSKRATDDATKKTIGTDQGRRLRRRRRGQS